MLPFQKISYLLTIGFVLLLPVSVSNIANAQQGHETTAEKINDLMAELTEEGFSGAVLVADDGNILLSQGYGFANREDEIPNTPDTVFHIGSVSKQFTGAAIVRLEMDGLLSTEDSIDQYFENVPIDKAAITIHQLLTHTSGLKGFGMIGNFGQLSRDEVVKAVLASKLVSPPGDRMLYSNGGYTLLAAIIEIASGQTYQQYLENKLFQPAEMTNSGFKDEAWGDTTVAQGYVDDAAVTRDFHGWGLLGAGGIYSTVNDLYKWYQALQGELVLSTSAKEKFLGPHVAENEGDFFYAYGWSIGNSPLGPKVVWHNGGDGIFNADFKWFPDEGTVIIVLSNRAFSDGWEFPAEYASIQIELTLFSPPQANYLDYWAGVGGANNSATNARISLTMGTRISSPFGPTCGIASP